MIPQNVDMRDFDCPSGSLAYMQMIVALVFFLVLFKFTGFVSSFFLCPFLVLISLKVSLWFSVANEGN